LRAERVRVEHREGTIHRSRRVPLTHRNRATISAFVVLGVALTGAVPVAAAGAGSSGGNLDRSRRPVIEAAASADQSAIEPTSASSREGRVDPSRRDVTSIGFGAGDRKVEPGPGERSWLAPIEVSSLEAIAAFARGGEWSSDVLLPTLEAIAGVTPLDVRAFAEEHTPDSAEAEETIPGDEITYREVWATADLDADSLADVVYVETRYEIVDEGFDPYGEFLWLDIVGVRGSDGGEIWRRRILVADDHSKMAYLWVTADLDGDGSADLSLLEWDAIESSLPGDPTGRWTFDAVAGEDGLAMWGRTVDSGSRGAREQGVGVWSRYGSLVLPVVVEDRDGDGGAELLFEVVDIDVREVRQCASLFGCGNEQTWRSITASTAVEVVSGGSGGSIVHLERTSQDQISLLRPVGDAVGTSVEDFAWVQAFTDHDIEADCGTILVECPMRAAIGAVEERHNDVVLLDGATMTRSWEIVLPIAPRIVDLPKRDFDGDGADDLELTALRPYPGIPYMFERAALTIVSGRTGERLWTREIPHEVAAWGYDSLGPVGGSPGDDLLWMEADEDFELFLRAIRLDGATGAVLLETEFDRDRLWDLVALELAGDADGDGTQDLLIGHVAGWREARFSVESGRDASTIRVFDAGPSNMLPVGDLDGDGTDDLVRARGEDHRRSTTILLEGVSMPSGARAWATNTSFDRDVAAYLWPIQDALGDGGADLVLQFAEWFPGILSRSAIVDGRTGSEAWTAGSVFPPAPPIGTARITGTVTDTSGEPLVGICVLPVPSEGWTTYPSETNYDGRFELSELNAGAYRIRFRDCYRGDFATRWLGGTVGADGSLSLDLEEGQELDGVTAELPPMPPPVNDARADAILIDGLPFEDERSLVGATMTPDEPEDCMNLSDEGTVWYRFNAATSGVIEAQVETSSAGYDIAVFEDQDGELRLMGCSGYSETYGVNRVRFEVEEGASYFLHVGGWSGHRHALRFELDAA